MSRRSCCVPGCSVNKKSGVPLHQFPNPETNAEKFKTWITNIGGEVTRLDIDIVLKNRRVCQRHFPEMYKYPMNRLSKHAIPVLHIPKKIILNYLGDADGVSTSGVQAQAVTEAVETSTTGHKVSEESQPDQSEGNVYIYRLFQANSLGEDLEEDDTTNIENMETETEVM